MPFPARARLRGASGKLLLAGFLTATLALSAWLGYQAVDAAGSHRRTAEGVLRDYAGIAAAEYGRIASDRFDDFLDQLFDDVPRRVDRDERLPGPSIVIREMDDAIEDARCECRALMERTWYFRVDRQRGGGELWPDTLPPTLLRELERMLAAEGVLDPPGRPGRQIDGLLTSGTAALPGPPSVIGYMVSRDEREAVEAVYGAVMERAALGELFEPWYRRSELLPAAIAGTRANDSLVSVTVLDPTGALVFESSSRYPADFSATDTLGADGGFLVVRASVRPDAAEHLIIGGLPRSRLPLLSTLLLLTLGLGVAALVQVHREHQLERLRDDFVSGVSHEFRTPLTQIRVFAELLEHGKLRSEDEQRRSIAVINREARRLTHLVENVLRFSGLRRVEEGRARHEVLGLGQVVDEVFEAFSPLAQARRVRLEADVDEDLRVRGSRTGLYQMLTNLLDNALKYGPDGQTVTVAARRVDGVVRISVDDEGPGIPPPERNRIWEPYRRLQKDVAGHVRGSGIGLAVVAELAAQHGGRAWVEDGVRNGTGGRFVVELDGSLDADASPGAVDVPDATAVAEPEAHAAAS